MGSLTRWIRLIIALTILAIAAPALTACAAVASALPLVTTIVTDALAVLSGIDTIVQEHFRRHPDISLASRQRYAQLYDASLRALRALQQSADGAKNLDEGRVREAFQAFEAAYNELKGWLLSSKLMNAQNQLLLDGQVVTEPLPEAQAFWR